VSEPLPWDDLMAIGMGRLKLAPACFWAMTPREFAAVAKGMAPPHSSPLGRSGLGALMARFPD
jgi:uncharacterized phage protein (TIGR02216 family)